MPFVIHQNPNSILCAWCPMQTTLLFQKGDAASKLAVSDLNSPAVYIYDVSTGSEEPIATLTTLHTSPVVVMKFNAAVDTVISSDTKGFIEYWSSDDYKHPSGAVKFTMKLDTDLYVLAKAKTAARSLEVSKDGSQFAVFAADGRVRVWRFASGKLRRSYDESLEAAHDLQKSGAEQFVLEDIDFGRRYALDKEIRAAGDRVPASNAVFDESGNFILVPTLLGIKVINLTTSAVSRMIGKPENTERFLRIALWQGLPKKVRSSIFFPCSPLHISN
eukprot:GHRR01014703.1.p1 GENE.GHRR01014703.1~~GHRR01014703.1.p1  ORF type:complete len:275 (+),score=76.87 GHRR01014703.1:1677-2501(+)